MVKIKDYSTIEDASVDEEEVSDGYEYEEGIPDTAIIKDIPMKELLKASNVADLLDEKTLDDLAEQVVDSYKTDKASRSHREHSMTEAMNMALQLSEEKTFPWPNASNVIFPIITEAAITFGARAYPAIVRGDRIALGKVIGSDKGQPALDQMGQKIPILDEQGKRQPDPDNEGMPLFQMAGAGQKKKRAKRIADYMNYQLMEEIEGWEEDTDKLLTALPITGNMYRKIYFNTELQRPETSLVYPRHLIVNYKAKSLARAPRITEEVELYPYEIMERILNKTFLDFKFHVANEEDAPLSDTDQAAGLQADYDNPHLFLQQCRKLDLDGDGYPEPYIITVHKDKTKTVRIKANFDKDGITRNKDEQISKIKCEEYYVKYGFIPSPDGSFYDLGWGELLLSLSKTINATLNKMIDAGTLATTSQGFIARGFKVRGGDKRFKPAEFKVADTRGVPLREGIFQMQHPEPSNVLFQLLGLLIESAKSIASLKEVLAGEQIANQSGIAALTLIEQGLTGFKSIYKRVYRSVKEELRLLYRLNSLYLNEQEYFRVMDEEQAVARADFDLKSVDVMPAADPTIVTDMQRMAKAQFLDGYRDDPYFEPKKLRQKIFEYIGEDSEELIVDAPPTPEDPMIEIQKMVTQIEGLKAENQAKGLEMKAQKDAQEIQLKSAQAEHQANINQMQADSKAQADQMAIAIKTQEAQIKMEAQVHELELKRAEMSGKDAKTAAEVEKINAQILEIYAKIELAKQQAITTANEKQEKKESEKSEKAENQENMGAAIKPLAEAVKSLKSDKKKLEIKKHSDGSITGSIE